MKESTLTTDAAAILAALADPTRLAMVRLLTGHKELCVCEVMDALGISQTRASRNLSLLCSVGLLSGEKRGKWMFYRLALNSRLSPLLAFVRRNVPLRGRPRKQRC